MYEISHSYQPSSPGFSDRADYSSGSRLEYIAENSSAPVSSQSYHIPFFAPQVNYSHQEKQNQLYDQSLSNQESIFRHQQMQMEYFFQPDNFLKPGKFSSFVGKAEEVKEFVEETFQKMFDAEFPNDIKISILEEPEFRKIAPSSGTIGLSINRNRKGSISEIFIINDYLARVILTIGHELGHVLTSPLDNPVDEEAKAYAFSLAWMETIKEHDIAGLSDVIITENPARNGLHDVAFSFVQKMRKQGKEWWNIYLQLIRKFSSVNYLYE